jgi:DNA polymerase III alpha subunit (gram-positive type)
MNRALKTALFLLVLTTLAFAADKLTVKQLQAAAKKFDGKEITVTGVVYKFEQRTSKAGNAYFIFKLADKADKKLVVNIYGQGKAAKLPKDGDQVELKGMYKLEKKVGNRNFKNELQIQRDAIKVLPAK